jgi:hypothetical protein
MTAGEVNLTEYFVDGERQETEIFGGSSIQNRLEISQLAINRRPNRPITHRWVNQRSDHNIKQPRSVGLSAFTRDWGPVVVSGQL